MKHSISKILLLVITVLAIVNCQPESFAQTSKEKTPPKAANYSITDNEVLTQKGFVNDFAEILDQPTKDKLEQTLAKFKSDAKIDFVIVTVKTTGEETAFDYSLSLAKDWAVGAKNPDKAGILMLIAVEDRHWHIQITRVLEKVLSDAEVGEFGALMRPLFREKKYGEGITRSVEKFIEVLKERRAKDKGKPNKSLDVRAKQLLFKTLFCFPDVVCNGFRFASIQSFGASCELDDLIKNRV